VSRGDGLKSYSGPLDGGVVGGPYAVVNAAVIPCKSNLASRT